MNYVYLRSHYKLFSERISQAYFRCHNLSLFQILKTETNSVSTNIRLVIPPESLLYWYH
jgi:hypothetical protein